mmetsp:Transcript_20417/g.48601  ORF Transcript_20417/g.48601 Transcript_20417/m.48601 type:complete len:264 (-) Transcript_20417:307-1098(-)
MNLPVLLCALYLLRSEARDLQANFANYRRHVLSEHCVRRQEPYKQGCTYECPEHSCVKSGRSCVNNFHDCECEWGWVKHDYEDICIQSGGGSGGCQKEQWPPKSGCHYTCPEHSCVKSGRTCVNNFDDCECDHGWEKHSGGWCVPEDHSGGEDCRRTQWPPKTGCSYECPEHSCVKSGRSCVNNFDDCECEYGWEKHSGGWCVTEDYSDEEGCRRTQWPPKTGCTYECPEHSCVKSGRSCVNNFDDCECDYGWEKHSGGWCVR